MKYYLNKLVDSFEDSRHHLVHVDSFPKLCAWYFENKAPDISDRCNSSRMHQITNKILNFVFHNTNKYKCPVSSGGGDSSATTSTRSSSFYSSSSVSSVSGSFGSTSEDECQGPPLYPARELLEAVPLVLEAMLTACAFGRMSSHDLTTGEVTALLLSCKSQQKRSKRK